MDPTTKVTRILVVDDHRTFTDLVQVALAGEPDLECVGAAYDVDQARSMMDELDPDVVLLDVELGGQDGLDWAAELLPRHPDLVVVILTAHATASVMHRCAEVGASALLPKDGSLPELLSCLRSARRSGFMVQPALLRVLVDAPTTVAGQADGLLTPREQAVLEGLAAGLTITKIARELGISVHTGRNHVKSLMLKLDVHSQLEAVVVAVMRGIVDAPRPR